jgi:hypothetical protein
VDTASTSNIIVFIWSDVTDTTAGDFLYITNIQLEKGSTATSFDYRDYGRELILCQRYYFSSGASDITITGIGTNGGMFTFSYPVVMRTSPTLSFIRGATANQIYKISDGSTEVQSWTILGNPYQPTNFYSFSSSFFSAGGGFATQIRASAEL